MSLRSKELTLSGWGLYPRVKTQVVRCERRQDVREAVQQDRACVARGNGRAYGDAAIGAPLTIDMTRADYMVEFDAVHGRVRCEAGVQLGTLLDLLVPRGWFLRVVPGTRLVTVGGCIASDVHGKNHHRAGSFGEHVRSAKLVLADGSWATCGPQHNSELFWATVGGMGLSGVIVDACLDLKPIPSAYIAQRTMKTKSLAETVAVLAEHDETTSYSVAWLDAMAEGKDLGKGIVILGEWAEKADVQEVGFDPWNLPAQRSFNAPPWAPSWLLNRTSMRLFNTLYYAAGQSTTRLVDYRTFFFPLDAICGWNRMYGSRGFVQYQCVLPLEHSVSGLAQLLNLVRSRGAPSFLTVLKRLGAANPGLLSFPRPGYTLCLDIAVKPGLRELMADLDAVVLRCGGRVYLAKDAGVSATTFARMYADQLPAWRQAKRDLDPEGRFRSALSQRLELSLCEP